MVTISVMVNAVFNVVKEPFVLTSASALVIDQGSPAAYKVFHKMRHANDNGIVSTESKP